MSEHDEQVAVMNWVREYEPYYSTLSYIFAYPSGSLRPYNYTKKGKRFSVVGQKLKDEGVKPGIPDLLMPYPCYGFNGLAIEMKYGRNKPTDEQKIWLTKLRSGGWATFVCYNWILAIWIIGRYINLPDLKRQMPFGWEDEITTDAINNAFWGDPFLFNLSRIHGIYNYAR